MHIPFPVHSHLRCKSTIFIRHRQRNHRKGRPATPLSEASSASASRPIYMEPHVSSMWNRLSHVRETVCFIYVEPCVPHTWNCVFHLRGTVRSTYMERSWNSASFVHIVFNVIVEVARRGVTIGTEDVENIILLLGREREYAVHVAVVSCPTAEIFLYFAAYRRVVHAFHVEEEFAEAPRRAYDALFHEQPAFAFLQGCGVDGGTLRPVGRHVAAGEMPHAGVVHRAGVVETERPCVRDGIEVERKRVGCHILMICCLKRI